MKPTVLLTGLLSMERYRLELGNMGNWYIAQSVLVQLSQRFSHIYSTWDISLMAQRALGISAKFTFIDPRQESKLLQVASSEDVEVLEIHGDLLGDNSLNLSMEALKDSLKLTQRLRRVNKDISLMATSIGPFTETKCEYDEIRKTMNLYKFIYLREHQSLDIARDELSLSTIAQFAPCPSVLFPDSYENIDDIHNFKRVVFTKHNGKPRVALALSRWNLPGVSFYSKDYPSQSLDPALHLIRQLSDLGYCISIVSHSNGFIVDERGEPKVTNGRDYELAKRLWMMSESRGIDCHIVAGLSPRSASKLLGDMDYVIAGRVHAGMISACQNVPTLFVEYANGPRAHKVRGFSDTFANSNTINFNAKTSSFQLYTLNPNDLALERERLKRLTKKIKLDASLQFDWGTK